MRRLLVVALLALAGQAEAALVSRPHEWWGWQPWRGIAHNQAMAFASNLPIDASGERFGMVFRWPAAGQPAKVRIHLGTVTSAQALRICFDGVDASGDPDGSCSQFRTVATGSVAVGGIETGIVTSDGTDTGTKRTVTSGERGAVVVDFSSTAGNVGVTHAVSTSFASPFADVYVDHYTSAWGKAAGRWPAAMSIEYADGSVYPIPGIVAATASATTETFNSGSTPDERGNTFQYPVDARVPGLWAWVDYDNAADLVMYSGTSAVCTATVPAAAVRGGTTMGLIYAPCNSGAVEITANTTYRTVVKPGASNVSVVLMSLQSAADRGAWYGTTYHATSRTDAAGSWTDSTTGIYQIGPVIDQVDDGAGGGGVSAARVPNGM